MIKVSTNCKSSVFQTFIYIANLIKIIEDVCLVENWIPWRPYVLSLNQRTYKEEKVLDLILQLPIQQKWSIAIKCRNSLDSC